MPARHGVSFSKNASTLAALGLTTQQDIACPIDAVNLKNRLCDVETDSRDRLHDSAASNRGSPSSTHILGTQVPV
jgi:hypothetical protein